MARNRFFAGANRIEPGTYTDQTGKVSPSISAGVFGKIALIDTGVLNRDANSDYYYGSGKGINGTTSKGKKNFQRFNSLSAFRSAIKGGPLSDLAQYLFRPSPSTPGTPELIYISASTTTPGSSIVAKYAAPAAVSGISVANPGVVTVASTSGLSTGDRVLFKGLGTGLLVGGKSLNERVFTITVINGTTFSIGVATTGIALGAGGTYQKANAYITLNTVEEGLFCNGKTVTKDVTNLTTGYGWKISAGIVDPSRYVVSFYLGTYGGVDKNGQSYNGLDSVSSVPRLLIQSPELSSILELYQWMSSSVSFKSLFTIVLYQEGSGTFTSADLTAQNSFRLFDGATQTYSSTDLDDVLSACLDLDNTFFFCDRWGFHTIGQPNYSNADDTENVKILAHCLDPKSKYRRYVFVGGGQDSDQLAQSSSSSYYLSSLFDSVRAHVVHGGITIPGIINGVRDVESIYTAAIVCGTIAGGLPQTSVTWKNLPSIRDVKQEYNLNIRENSIQSGVILITNVDGIGWCVNFAVNAKQSNLDYVDGNGESYDIAIEMIGSQLDKNLILNINRLVIAKNRGIVSPGDIQTIVERVLRNALSTKNNGNMILNYDNVIVQATQDYVDITYDYTPDGPINQAFVTRTVVDLNASS